MKLYQLNDQDTRESIGLVRVIHDGGSPLATEEELRESWTDFHSLQEHELDPNCVDDFVEWHNENYVSQIEREYYEVISV